jgi:hypothetical protein
MILRLIDKVRHWFRSQKLRRDLEIAGWRAHEIATRDIDPVLKEAAHSYVRRKEEESVRHFLDD